MTKPVDHTAIERFVLNHAVTAHHREQLVADGELEPSDVHEWCCYSQCSMLVVGDPGPAPAPLPLPTPELCIPRPPAGTSQPAVSNRGCRAESSCTE